MALKDTVKKMKDLLESIQGDLVKAENGNKAASQRVRTDSIKLEKVAKTYRKESIKAEKSGLVKRKPASKKAAASSKRSTVKKVAKPACRSMKKVVTKKCATRSCAKKTPAKKKTASRRSSKK